MNRTNVSSGSPWESSVGYSRAVRVGELIWVSGTTASDQHGQCVAVGDGYGQARYILEKIQSALAELNASMSDVVRTRMFVTDIDRWEEFGRAHAECFGTVKPVATMVQVERLIDRNHLIEIEVDAVAS